MIRDKLVGAARGLGIWFIGSLFAVLLLEYNALLGLGFALALGILMGILLFRSDSAS